jgi:hypothetical protein
MERHFKPRVFILPLDRFQHSVGILEYYAASGLGLRATNLNRG